MGTAFFLLVVRGGSRFSRDDDLILTVHHGQRIVAVVEALVAPFHDSRIGVGEVGLRLVLGSRIHWRGFLTATLFPGSLAFRFRGVTSP
jgi:hypothetical protein